MPSSTSAHTPLAAAPIDCEPVQSSVVLDRVAARVRRRLAAEEAATNRDGDGSHAASLILPRPL